MALLNAANPIGMEDFKTESLFDDYNEDDVTDWLDRAIDGAAHADAAGFLDDIKVEHDIWQGAAAADAGEPAQLPAAQPQLPPADPACFGWPAQSAATGTDYSSSSGSSTASASPSRMQSDMLDVMGDFGDFSAGGDAFGLDLEPALPAALALPVDPAGCLDTVRADVMLSSSLSFLDRPAGGRNRDNSLTLSECADSLFKDLDILGTSPNSNNSLNAFFDTPMASECGSDPEATEDETEIEVVDNRAAATLTANNTTYYVTSSKKSAAGIRAGRSLLRKNHKYTSDRPRPSSSILESAQLDHCYSFNQPPMTNVPHGASRGSNNHGLGQGHGGPLTPTASSDDECERRAAAAGAGRQSLLGKRKHAAAAAAVADQQQRHLDDGELKFKFGMKFGSSYSPQRRGKRGMAEATDQTQQQTAAEQSLTRQGPKRRSAMKNTHCPSPTKDSPAAAAPSAPSALPAAPQHARLSKPAHATGSLKSLRKSGGGSSASTGEQRCRELRDLHNSMERQRRVDLKINFDQLKDKVVELRDVDKASKMVILNKAAEYARLLQKTDHVLGSERERVARRNAELRQRLEAAKRNYYSGASLPSRQGRIAAAGHRHHPSLLQHSSMRY